MFTIFEGQKVLDGLRYRVWSIIMSHEKSTLMHNADVC